jgi:hypothetical protein
MVPFFEWVFLYKLFEVLLMDFEEEHDFALFIILTEQEACPLNVILNTESDAFLEEEFEVIAVLIMLVFDD